MDLDILVGVMVFFTAMMFAAINGSKKKQQQSGKTGHMGLPDTNSRPPRPTRPNSPQGALEELRRLLEVPDEHSSEVEDGVETYMEPESVVATPVEVGAEEGVRSTVTIKEEQYSLDKKNNESAKGVKVEIEPRNLIIYSEIMCPKWKEY